MVFELLLLLIIVVAVTVTGIASGMFTKKQLSIVNSLIVVITASSTPPLKDEIADLRAQLDDQKKQFEERNMSLEYENVGLKVMLKETQLSPGALQFRSRCAQ